MLQQQMSSVIAAGIVLLLVVCTAVQTAAQPQQNFVHPLSQLPPGGDVTAVSYFPEYPTKHFPAGGKIKAVVAIHNDGAVPYNLTAIMGSINSPENFNLYIQNFTQQYYFNVVPGGSEFSLEYLFVPAPALPAREYTLALTLFYESVKDPYLSTTFFNGTIDIVDMPRMVDTELLILYAGFFGLLGFGAYMGYRRLAQTGFFKRTMKRAKQPTVVKQPTAAEEDDWLQGTPYGKKKTPVKKPPSKQT